MTNTFSHFRASIGALRESLDSASLRSTHDILFGSVDEHTPTSDIDEI